jgi:hypothetical protein
VPLLAVVTLVGPHTYLLGGLFGVKGNFTFTRPPLTTLFLLGELRILIHGDTSPPLCFVIPLVIEMPNDLTMKLKT